MELFTKRFKGLIDSSNLSQIEIARGTGIRASSISDYYNGKYIPKQDKIILLAEFLQVDPSWLAGVEQKSPDVKISTISNLTEPQTIQVPILGRIAAGRPILAEENYDNYLYLDRTLKVDFCLEVKGDSMIEAGIFDGDIALLRQQPRVENGEIGAVVIDNEATLKKVQIAKSSLILNPCNPKYEPIVITEHDPEAKIVGKLVGVIHKF